jgi:hypothetical protein
MWDPLNGDPLNQGDTVVSTFTVWGLSVFLHDASAARVLAVGCQLAIAHADWSLRLPTGDCSTNQPTKKLTKGGVKHRRETSSLARFDHSCVRNALLEMVNVALN